MKEKSLLAMDVFKTNKNYFYYLPTGELKTTMSPLSMVWSLAAQQLTNTQSEQKLLSSLIVGHIELPSTEAG